MSLRAIKKKETNQLLIQHQKPYKKFIKNKGGQQKEISCNTLNRNKRSKSYPNLPELKTNQLLNLHNYQSEPDFRQIEQTTMAYNVNLCNAKSEVCVQTISVHNTSNHMNNTERKCISNDNTNNMNNDFNNNNNNTNIRRLSNRSDFTTITSSNTATISESDVQGISSGVYTDNHIMRIPIIGYEVMEERARFTVYKLRVENPFTNDCWLVLRRYTDFVRLNNKLKATFPNFNLILPRKKLFGNNFNSGFLGDRVQGLQIFINTILANTILRNSRIVRDFFCLDEPPAYSESMEECRAIFEAQEETITHLKLQLNNKNDIIMNLQQKLTTEISENANLKSAIKNNCENCSKCASHQNMRINININKN